MRLGRVESRILRTAGEGYSCHSARLLGYWTGILLHPDGNNIEAVFHCASALAGCGPEFLLTGSPTVEFVHGEPRVILSSPAVFARALASATVLATCLLAPPAFAQTESKGTDGSKAADRLGVPGPLRLAGTEYVLAWSSQPARNYMKQEYVPAGENPQTYTKMLLLEFLSGKVEPLAAARAQVAKLEERKGSDPLVNMDLIQNKSTGEVLLDFIVSQKDEKGEYIVEWNVYRYAPHKDGVLLYGASHRAYGNEAARSFLQNLKTLRTAQIDALARAPLPKVALAK
jgi:hypothetical protein